MINLRLCLLKPENYDFPFACSGSKAKKPGISRGIVERTYNFLRHGRRRSWRESGLELFTNSRLAVENGVVVDALRWGEMKRLSAGRVSSKLWLLRDKERHSERAIKCLSQVLVMQAYTTV